MSTEGDSGTLNASEIGSYLYAIRDKTDPQQSYDHHDHTSSFSSEESPSSPFITNPEVSGQVSRIEASDIDFKQSSEPRHQGSFENYDSDSFEDASEVINGSAHNISTKPTELTITPIKGSETPHKGTKSPFKPNPNDTIEEMDASIASLRESLANLRADKSSLHNATIDTSRYNDTQAQLDMDLSFEKPVKSSSASSKNLGWGKFRAPYTSVPQLSFQPTHTAKTSSSNYQDASSAPKLDDLNKQITGYRIQIKFFKQFLQNLIDKSRSSDNDGLDLEELTMFQQNFNRLAPFKSDETTKLEKDHEALLKNYDEIFKLNEDLYENLEVFQTQLQAKETHIHSLNKYIDACTRIVDDILQVLMHNPKTDGRTKEALEKCMDTSSTVRPLEIKLQVISFEFNELLKTDHFYPTPPNSQYNERDQEETISYIGIIEDLMKSIETLEREFNVQKAETAKLEQELKAEVQESSQIKQNYRNISQKFTTLCQTMEKQSTSGMTFEEMSLLRAENAKLNAINNAVDAKFSEYQKVIDRLQVEVNGFKEYSKKDDTTHGTTVTNVSDTEHELQVELLESHKALSSLHDELQEVTEHYTKLKEDSSHSISRLTHELHQAQQEISAMKAEERVTEKSKNDLDIAVEKQRIYKSENIRLSYKVEALTNDKQSLQSTIRSLTDKITSLTVGETLAGDKTDTVKKLNVLEYQFKELVAVDMHEFQKLLKSFNKIADDSSVKDPTRKIESLGKRLAKMDESSNWDSNDFNHMRELHRSVFDYFARAVEMIVNDHVKLLLKESEGNVQKDEYVEKLHKRIDELNEINDSLGRRVEGDDRSVLHEDSPRTKMRMDELWNRWKAEREARVYESKQANRRLKELELENSRLRAELEGESET